MGVEFAHLMIPRDNTWHPTPAQVAQLMDAWEGLDLWGPAEDLDVQVHPAGVLAGEVGAWFDPEAAHDLMVSHFVQAEAPPEHFPFDWRTELGEDWSFEMQLLRAPDLVEPVTGEHIAPLDATCECGRDLRFTPSWDDTIFYGDRIHRTCPRCRRLFRPQDREVTYRNPFDGQPSPLPGGTCFRFAIRLQAGKGLNPVPRVDGRLPRATPEFLRLCEAALGQTLYEVGYLY